VRWWREVEVVGEAADGAAAGRRRVRSPDLVLLDIQLPDIDGFAVCDQLVADEAAPAAADPEPTPSYRKRSAGAARGFIPGRPVGTRLATFTEPT
jgi:CheY-like chemotaxis protein